MYLFSILLFTLFALLEVLCPKFVQKYQSVLAFVAFSFLVVHDGLRWETGTDWMSYLTFFQTVDTLIPEDTYFEPGYFYFVQSIRSLSNDYTAYLLIHAIVFYGLIFYAIFKLSNAPFLSILLLYMIILPFLGMNRQFLAVALALMGMVFLARRKILVFVLFILFASLFHKSVLCCLVMPLFVQRYNNGILIGMLFIAIIVSATGIINTFAPALTLLMMEENRSNIYLDNFIEISLVSSFLSLFRKLIWVLLLMLYDRAIENKTRTYTLFFNLYFVSILIYILCNGTMLQMVVSRMLIYFNLAEIFILPYLLTVFKPLRDKVILILLFSVYTFINIQKGISNYGEDTDYFTPYKGIFINTDYAKRDVLEKG